MSTQELLERWRRKANEFRDWGWEPQAKMLEHAASELEQSIRERDDELLTLEQAAAESGYTRDHLGRIVRHGGLPNSGEKGKPRIRRGDLQRWRSLRLATDEHSLERTREQIARAAVMPYVGGQ